MCHVFGHSITDRQAIIRDVTVLLILQNKTGDGERQRTK